MRLIPAGTSSRSKQYIFPGWRSPLFWISLAVGLGIAIALTVALLGGLGFFFISRNMARETKSRVARSAMG